MIRFLFSRRSTFFIIISLVCSVLCFNFYACAEESLICSDDIEKYCKDVRPGGGRLLNCLKTHETELSAPCRDKISELQKIIKDCEEACSDDITQFCKEVKPGGKDYQVS